MNTIAAAHEVDARERHLPRVVESGLGNRRRRWAALLDRIAAGDINALGALYDESSSLAFGLIMHILQDAQAAEDALLDVYTQVRDRARVNAAERDPVSWLMALARDAAVARLRWRRHFSQPMQLPPLPSASAATSVMPFDPFHRECQEVSHALDQLTARQRAIIQMTYFGGFSGRAVADALKISTEQVMSEIRRAMSTLRNSLASVDAD
jgi:RNA polymerase sigma-70 factor (ECF subfamily)